MNPTQTRIGDYVLYEVDIYELAKTYSTTSRSFTVLGVSVKVNFTYPRLLINDEQFTFSYKVVVGNAPQGWQINVTDVTLSYVSRRCFAPTVQKINKVLKGGEQLFGGFTVVPIIKLDPGYTTTLCDTDITIRYEAVFGQNRETSSLVVSANPKAKSKELPLRLSLDVSGANVGVRVKNLQNGDISITAIKYCDWYPDSPDKLIGCSWWETSLSDIVVKPGEERLIPLRDFKLENREGHIAFVLQYLYAGGRAENWLVLRVSREPAAGVAGTVIQTKTFTPTQVGTLTTRAKETKPEPRPPILPDILLLPLRIVLFVIDNFGLLVALLTGFVVLAVIYSVLKEKRIKPAETLRPQQPPPAGSDQSMRVEPPESRRLKTPAGLSERIHAILGGLNRAGKYYFELNDERNSVLSLYEAVNGTLNLLLEAEGLSYVSIDDPRIEITIREKARLLFPRGWISQKTAGYFTRLELLRKMASIPDATIYSRIAKPGEVGKLLKFFNSYVQNVIKRLRDLVGPEVESTKPPAEHEPSNAFPLGKHMVVELDGELSCTKCGRTAPLSEADKLAEAACVQPSQGEAEQTNRKPP
jgi:hypothetical protein